ncbi:hypothetical protein COU78_03995 [Candidatus Peregrinibacteria bacterium CG10_big_fil_rev_8_21_14_0_10_49_24]|nr:MAG: hypothetical protein COV83_00040 [Candidatus Peregrinibacteria bacterium CG11_big_fil_rev_8_21_14_0_20_49_14]PIR50934.1 MAG: hypothetical protein COU78_03995 [Candidatus Peregrinibacteria bacterium CG10_big_fil_rev_8_21_14_0_10_49_24]PJA67679.1 MAG: hypothetical protein CO157_03335 [Candidatus Peregrinibacteria bacterium CG_4_9_14_3_um_filter_49_12]
MSTADSGNFTSFGGPNEGFGGSESLGGTPPLNPKEVSQEEVDALSAKLSGMPPEATQTVYENYRENGDSGALASFEGVPAGSPGGMGGAFESGSSVRQETGLIPPENLGTFNNSQNKTSGLDAIDARKRGDSAETIRTRSLERARQAKEVAENTAIQHIIDRVFGDLEPKKNNEIAAKLLKVFGGQEDGNIGYGMNELGNRYEEINKLPENERDAQFAQLLTVFTKDEIGFSQSEAMAILKLLSGRESKQVIAAASEAGASYTAALIANKNESDAFVNKQIAIAQAKTEEEADAIFEDAIEEVIEEELLRNPNSKLAQSLQQNLVSIREQKTEIRRIEELAKQAELNRIAKSTKVTAQTAATLVEFGVRASALTSLPPDGQAAVESAVNRGGGRMIGALLSGDTSHTEKALTGEISGQHISLDFNDGELYLIGEKAADRANQGEYRIDPPTPAGFETVLIHSIGEQNRMPYIAQHGQQAAAIWERFAGRTDDEQLPEAKNIDLFRNFIILLIGEGNPGEAEEGSRLQELGILTQGVESVDRSRVELFARALEKYVPGSTVLQDGDSGGLGGAESPSFNFDDALTLAQLWDKSTDRFPASINELKNLTDIRLEGGDIHNAEYR